MEVPCPDLLDPHAFYLLGTAEDVAWHGAPIRLLLVGLYQPGALRSYLPASAELYRQCLTPANIDSWLRGAFWPREAP